MLNNPSALTPSSLMLLNHVERILPDVSITKSVVTVEAVFGSALLSPFIFPSTRRLLP